MYYIYVILFLQERSDYAADMKKCEEFLTNIEAGFIAIMKDLMKKCGKPFTDLLKVFLDCSICKGLITTVTINI